MPRPLAVFPLTADQLRAIIRYEPETGRFAWVERPREMFRSNNAHAAWNARYANREAGMVNAFGYRVIMLEKRPWPAHRLAWLYMTGEWPQRLIDHINMSKGDNRWTNLRLATDSQNTFHQAVPRSMPRGVIRSHNKTNPYRAKITVERRTYYLGYYPTVEAASAAFQAAADKHFGAFAPKS